MATPDTKKAELELFDYLSRNSRFREWLEAKLVEEAKILIQVLDIEQLRRAQGRAGLMQIMLALLDQAPKAMAQK